MIKSYEYELSTLSLVEEQTQSNENGKICNGTLGSENVEYFEMPETIPEDVTKIVNIAGDKSKTFYSTRNGAVEKVFIIKMKNEDISAYSGFYGYYSSNVDKEKEQTASSIILAVDKSNNYGVMYVYQGNQISVATANPQVNTIYLKHKNVVKIFDYIDSTTEHIIIHTEE